MHFIFCLNFIVFFSISDIVITYVCYYCISLRSSIPLRGSRRIIGVGSLVNSSTASGLSGGDGYSLGTSFFFRDIFTSFHTHASRLTFFCFLFHSWCSHARVFGKTLLNWFPFPIAILNGTYFFRETR